MAEQEGAVKALGSGKLIGPALAGTMVLAACSLPIAPETPPLYGTVDFPGRAYGTQATIEEIASAATVSLIDASRSVTVATTLTDSHGAFSLALPRWRPVEGQCYYLEAIKGLGGNRAGRSAARVRTLVRNRADTGWMSISGGGAVVISASTTAICAVSSLKGAARVNPDQLIGSLSVGANGSTATPPDAFMGADNFSSAEFASVWNFVDSAVTQGVDPVASLSWDSGSNTFTLSTPYGPYIRALTPNSGAPGTEILIEGSRFAADAASNSVDFGGLPATVLSASETALRVRIPEAASTGYVRVTTSIGTSNLAAFMAVARIGGTYRDQ